jgi:hypothetical protein
MHVPLLLSFPIGFEIRIGRPWVNLGLSNLQGWCPLPNNLYARFTYSAIKAQAGSQHNLSLCQMLGAVYI